MIPQGERIQQAKSALEYSLFVPEYSLSVPECSLSVPEYSPSVPECSLSEKDWLSKKAKLLRQETAPLFAVRLLIKEENQARL